MPILNNIKTLFSCRPEGGQADCHEIHQAALIWQDDRILWLGEEAAIPSDYHDWQSINAHGAIVIPGLVDCHTHLAFAGWREEEFVQRCRGMNYLDIARRGGGIVSTVKATRAASEEELYTHARENLKKMLKLGVTTVECKSGYGLTLDDELKILRVYKRLEEERIVDIHSTFLGAHTLAPEYCHDRKGYISLLCETMIPLVAEEDLARFCDVFVEETAFTPDEARRILSTAKSHGLSAKLHVDQLKDGGGAKLAAELGAVSADHLEYASDEGLAAMRCAGVIAVILPIASLYLQQVPINARRCIEQGLPVAVATDFNPGSAPCYHLTLAMTLACIMNHMTPHEVLKASTYYAAKAIAQEDVIGSLEPGKRAHFILLNSPSISHYLYHFEPNKVMASYAYGRRT